MKTSNKILLGTFFTVLLILVGMHVAIYAKYKKGDYRLVTSDDMWPNMISQSLINVKYVTVANVGNLTIQTADSNKIRYDKPGSEELGSFEITQKADTLFLLGKNQDKNGGKWYRAMNLSLSGPIPVKIINSDLHVEGANQDFSPASMDISLDKSIMEIGGGAKKVSGFKGLKIHAINESRVSFYDVQANFLDISLSNSSFVEQGFTADSIRVTTDLNSKLELSGKNLLKSKIVTNE